VVPQKHLAIVLNHLASVSRGLANGSERETGQQRGQKEDPPPLPFSHREKEEKDEPSESTRTDYARR
jgi:hypothetical protein